jgi:hypothetical protein
MSIPTVKVKDKSGNEIIVNKSDEHLYAEYNKKPVKRKPATKKPK